MRQILSWLLTGIMCLFCLAVFLLLLFVVACIAVEGTKKIKEEIKKE